MIQGHRHAESHGERSLGEGCDLHPKTSACPSRSPAGKSPGEHGEKLARVALYRRIWGSFQQGGSLTCSLRPGKSS